MITCEEAAKLLNEYLDKELTEQDVREFEAHVKACKRCFGCLEFSQAVRQVLKKKVRHLSGHPGRLPVRGHRQPRRSLPPGSPGPGPGILSTDATLRRRPCAPLERVVHRRLASLFCI